MAMWITSDLHLFHSNLLQYCPVTRPFETVEDLHAFIISTWNSQVKSQDSVYILGDVALTSNVAAVVDILNRLKGRKFLVIGNHDTRLLKSQEFRSCFVQIEHYLEIKYQKHTICMSHYPMASWNRRQYGSLMLHGHCHGRPVNVPGRIMDVGFDATGKVVSSLDEVIADLVSNHEPPSSLGLKES